METWKTHINNVPLENQCWSWEGGTYERNRRHLSVALGSTKESPHPFDVEVTRVPPGASPCPVHSHSSSCEFFIIVSGHAYVERNGEKFEAIEGDCISQPPKTKHRIRNASKSDELVFYVIADEVDDDEVTKHEI